MFVALASLAVALGTVHAVRLAWYGDDVFITLRYVANWLHGHGVVYNAGERVEGYTHFLWLVLLAAASRLGVDPLVASLTLGVLAYAATLAVVARTSWRLAGSAAGAVIPGAALLFAANTDATVWATGGLETALFTLLLTLAFHFGAASRRAWISRLRLAGVALGLAALTRPDGLLVCAFAGAVVAMRALVREDGGARAALRDVANLVAPMLALVVPHLLWRHAYYGAWLPNTYWAKSAGRAWWSQGLYYCGLFVSAYPTLALVLVAVALQARAALRALRERTYDALEHEALGAPLVLTLGVATYVLGFVARVGGDFMFGRFLVPMLPFAYLLLEWGVRRVLPRRAWLVLLVLPLVTLVGEAALRDRLIVDRHGATPTAREHHGIVDERTYYTLNYPLAADRDAGTWLRPYFAGKDALVLLRGQACLGYYGDFARCLESAGLTDSALAHRPIAARGRIGHEKAATYRDLVERGVHFVFARPLYIARDYRSALFSSPDGLRIHAEIISYDPALLESLKAAMGDAFEYVRFEDALDDYLAKDLMLRTPAELRSDLSEFTDYYFRRHPDPRRERIVARLRELGG